MEFEFLKYSSIENIPDSQKKSGNIVQILEERNGEKKWILYKYSVDLELIRWKGISNEQEDKLEEIDNAFLEKVKNDTYTKSEVDEKVSNITLADEEDLTRTVKNSLEVLQFKDRARSLANHIPLGYKILRKNIVGGKNILSADLFASNAIVEIRHEYDLNGQVVEIPDNVTLKFNGGLLKNGELKGIHTKVDAGLYQIFELGMTFSGSFIVDFVYPEWFGAKSYPDVGSDTNLWSGSPAVLAGEPCQAFINDSFKLSLLSSGNSVALVGRSYLITDTINVPMRTSFHIGPNSHLEAIMNGSGLSIVTSDLNNIDTFTEETKTEKIFALNFNQYIKTTAMKVAIKTTPSSKITGHGRLNIARSTFTIGVYIEGQQYWYTDMTLFPEIDIRTIGGAPTGTVPDVNDMSGNGMPDASLGVDGQFYFNKSDSKLYKKESGSWVFFKNCQLSFNTSVRLEAHSGFTDFRIIGIKGGVYDIYGFRGIEVIARTSVNGWINQGVWSGSVSNKISNYVSFFGTTHNHDMSRMTYQSGVDMNGDCKIISVVGTAWDNSFGNTWDLEYANFGRSQVKYYFGLGTNKNNVVDLYNVNNVLDEGRDNSFGAFSIHKKDTVDAGYSRWINLTKYRSPVNQRLVLANRGKYWEFNSIIPVKEMLTTANTVVSGTVDPVVPKVFFDQDHATFKRVVDTSNNLFGASFQLITNTSHPAIRSKKVVVKIRYGINNFMAGFPLIFVAIGEVPNIQNDKFLFVKRLRNQMRSSTGGTAYSDNVEYIEIAGLTGSLMQNKSIAFYTTDASPNIVLDVYSVEVFVDSLSLKAGESYNLDKSYGTTANRPDAAPKGHIYEDTTLGKTIINTGDSINQIWKEIPLGTTV